MEYLILVFSLAGIVIGANYLVSGAVSVARRFKVSDFVIGAAIVGVGTSMPEFVVSFIGALNGNADVAIGNVVGSNIFNVLGILGLTALFFPVAIDRKNMKFEIPFAIGVSALLTLLALNFFNGEAHGEIVPESHPLYFMRMGLLPNEDSLTEMFYYHPTFFYESAWNLIGFIIVTSLYTKKKFNGQIACMYLSWYGFGRMWIEGLRTDSLWLIPGVIRVSIFVAVVTLIAECKYFVQELYHFFVQIAIHHKNK